jgi:hypothetical protein
VSDDIEAQTPPDDETPRSVTSWPFMPGDRVLCLIPTGEGEKLEPGEVQAIRIPGPMSPHKIIQVMLDDLESPIRIAWWDPDRVERYGQ